MVSGRPHSPQCQGTVTYAGQYLAQVQTPAQVNSDPRYRGRHRASIPVTPSTTGIHFVFTQVIRENYIDSTQRGIYIIIHQLCHVHSILPVPLSPYVADFFGRYEQNLFCNFLL